MKIFKKTILIFIALIVLIIAGGWMYFNNLKPSYSGNIKLLNIEMKLLFILMIMESLIFMPTIKKMPNEH